MVNCKPPNQVEHKTFIPIGKSLCNSAVQKHPTRLEFEIVKWNRQESNLYLQIFSLLHRPALLLFQIWAVVLITARRPSNRLFLFFSFLFSFFLFRHFFFYSLNFSVYSSHAFTVKSIDFSIFKTFQCFFIVL